MTRQILSAGDFSANYIGVEPDSTITDLDIWAYLNTGLASSPNMVTDVALTQTGTVVFEDGYATVTPGTNYLTATSYLDVSDQTIMFVARTTQTGGNFSPIITSNYSSTTGIMVALGWTYLRIHAIGFGAIGNYTLSSTFGNDWSFWSVILDSGHATPIRVKNHTHSETSTGGTAAGNRTSTGGVITVAGHTIATTGTFASDIAWIGRAKSILTDDQLTSCYDSVRLGLIDFGIVGV